MKLVSLLSGNGFVLYNKDIARSLSVNSAIIFGQVCASYESFEKKGMLTIRDGKEYFFLTSEVIEEETALSYKLQLKATKELEEAGYIETKVMGVPSKKYFHITDKIIKLLVNDNLSSSQKEDLKDEETAIEHDSEDMSFSQREHLAIPKESGKPLPSIPTIKNKNLKIKNKNIKDNIVNKEPVYNDTNEFKKIAMKIFEKYYAEFCPGRWDKDTYLDLIAGTVINEIIDSGRWKKIENVEGYIYSTLKQIAYKSDCKFGRIDTGEVIAKRLEGSTVPFFNWLEEVE
jgi:hypothetical protein